MDVDPIRLDETTVEPAAGHDGGGGMENEVASGEQLALAGPFADSAPNVIDQQQRLHPVEQEKQQQKNEQRDPFAKRQRDHSALMIPRFVTSSAIR